MTAKEMNFSNVSIAIVHVQCTPSCAQPRSEHFSCIVKKHSPLSCENGLWNLRSNAEMEIDEEIYIDILCFSYIGQSLNDSHCCIVISYCEDALNTDKAGNQPFSRKSAVARSTNC